MRTAPYVKQERTIVASDSGGIRQRWRWGLRILNDPEAMSSEKSLKHGTAEQLIKAAAKRGLKLNNRSIRERMQCARAYPTEAQIGAACADFETWSDLRAAGFPAYEIGEDDNIPADFRFDDERADAERAEEAAVKAARLDLWGDQPPLDLDVSIPDRYDPTTTVLKELVALCDESEKMTANFAATDRRRRGYVNRLLTMVNGDESALWIAAHKLLAAQPAIDDDSGVSLPG